MAHWKTTVDDHQYTVTINNGRIEWSAHQGTPESYGGKELPISQFLRTKRLKGQIRRVFGENVLRQIMEAAVMDAPNQRPKQMRASGPPCASCGCLLRTALASYCVECGAKLNR